MPQATSRRWLTNAAKRLSPGRFNLMPDGPSDAFKSVMSDVPDPPPDAKSPRFAKG
ncbi:hypothetical protein [Streptomyces hirsutus]|uniref:hypothetical protein n=1 Tax=Streptomyces hirsutus TaxID=35620 RepID=UPI0033C70059